MKTGLVEGLMRTLQFLIITALLLIAAPAVGNGELPCSYERHLAEHNLAVAAFSDVIGRPGTDEYHRISVWVGRTFGNMIHCERQNLGR